MRLLPFLILLCLLSPQLYASARARNNSGDSVSIPAFARVAVKEKHAYAGSKMNFIQKLQWKIVQKKFRKTGFDKATSKDSLATIALIAGVAGFVLLFVVPIAGFVLLLTAIITGILGKKNNENPKSRKKALIGLVLGLVAFGLILAFAIAYSGGF